MCVRVLHTSLTTVYQSFLFIGYTPIFTALIGSGQHSSKLQRGCFQLLPTAPIPHPVWVPMMIHQYHALHDRELCPASNHHFNDHFQNKMNSLHLRVSWSLKVCYKASKNRAVSIFKKIEEFMQPKNNRIRVRVQSVCLWWNRPQTRADVRSWHVRQCQGFLQRTIIVYHRDDRQNLFRDLFMQIKSQVKCKYLLSSSPEWICQSFYQIFCPLNPCLGRSLGPSCS